MPTITATNRNAYDLWKAGAISATNIGIETNWLQTTPAPNDGSAWATAYVTQDATYRGGLWNGCENTLHNIVLKSGFNAVRVFMDMQAYKNSANQTIHDVSTIAANGWNDYSTERTVAGFDSTGQKQYATNRIASYKLLATQIDNLLTLCQRLGIGLILCPGSFYSGANEALWTDAQLQNDFVNFWDKTAARWAQHPALIAFELINEPAPGHYKSGGSDLAMFYKDMQTGTHNYKALVERCIQKIRQYDTVTPVMVSSIHGGNPNGFDYFLNSNVGLIKDATSGGTLIDKVVYTAHVYTPSRYTHQGIYFWGYHATGLCYPNFTGMEYVYGDGTGGIIGFDFKTPDSTGKYNQGMLDVYAGIAAFKAQAPGRPVFIGEFSASSGAYLQAMSKDAAGFPQRASNYISQTDPSRAVVGLNYDAATDEGVLVLRHEIYLFDVTETDTYGRKWSRNKVNLLIKPLPGQDRSTIAPYDVFGDETNIALKGVTLEGNFYRSTDPNSGEQNCLIRFKWPFAQKPGTNLGVSHVDGNGPIRPSTLLTTFDTTKPAQIAVIQIMLDDTQVKAQEASRQLYARDVLRQCARLGLSWAWFCSYSVKNDYLWGDKFWQAENANLPLQGSSGQLARTLKRATGQSYE